MLHTDIAWLNILIFAVGLAFLVKGSDWFVDGAAFVAHRFNVPKIVIGLTLVSIGTSLPELATDVYSSIQGLSDATYKEIPMGDTPGSNISNILLVLGLSVVLIKKVPIDKLLFGRDTMIMSAIFLIFAIMYYNFDISQANGGGAGINRFEGGVLFLIFIAYMTFLIKRKDEISDEVCQIEDQAEKKVKNLTIAIVFLVLGGAMIAFGAKLMVDNAAWGARRLGIPATIISATVIAFGTSLPELSVTVAGILKKETDIALGNIIGSNIFNLVFVMAVASMIGEVPVVENANYIVPYMLASAAVLVVFMRTEWTLVRWEGIVLLLLYVIYISINVYTAVTLSVGKTT
ncbi:MAG: calcium/sodium antiporter [Phycisphaerales bacterium]|jgi:cation:H+ antiporter|nr:calcium/sodium antiporter [Phycisphaerales bacterium]